MVRLNQKAQTSASRTNFEQAHLSICHQTIILDLYRSFYIDAHQKWKFFPKYFTLKQLFENGGKGAKSLIQLLIGDRPIVHWSNENIFARWICPLTCHLPTCSIHSSLCFLFSKVRKYFFFVLARSQAIY